MKLLTCGQWNVPFVWSWDKTNAACDFALQLPWALLLVFSSMWWCSESCPSTTLIACIIFELNHSLVNWPAFLPEEVDGADGEVGGCLSFLVTVDSALRVSLASAMSPEITALGVGFPWDVLQPEGVSLLGTNVVLLSLKLVQNALWGAPQVVLWQLPFWLLFVSLLSFSTTRVPAVQCRSLLTRSCLHFPQNYVGSDLAQSHLMGCSPFGSRL